MVNNYSRKYELDFDKVFYDKMAGNTNLEKIYGEIGDSLLVRGNPKNLVLIERNKNGKETTIKIHSENPGIIQSQLESITGMDLLKHRIY